MNFNQYFHPVKIGQYTTENNLFVAPMAGVTDRPFRHLCKKWGAGHAVSEMMSANPNLKDNIKTQKRASHIGEKGLIAVQIVGSDGAMMAETALHNIRHGANIIDINMGCPARKVCNVASGSALLKDEKKVYEILSTLTKNVWQEIPDVPITLKIRTGWCPNSRNAVNIAKMAQDLGISLLTIHGRTRACGYTGHAEYDTIAQVKEILEIPLIANGDIHTADDIRYILDYTKANGVMLGRGIQGAPWLFDKLTKELLEQEYKPLIISDIKQDIIEHLNSHHQFYGDFLGVRTARKHLLWYIKNWQIDTIIKNEFQDKMLLIENTSEQVDCVNIFLEKHQHCFVF